MFLDLQTYSWVGPYPNQQIQTEIDKADYTRYLPQNEGGKQTIELETVVATFQAGKIFGDIALIDSKKAKRYLFILIIKTYY